MPLLADLVALARPRHWIKGAFVLLPVPFALAAGATLDAVRLATGLAAISLASSAAYALNDARDAERDRRHPDKQRRPVAAGRVGPLVAYLWGAALLAAAVALLVSTGSDPALAVLGVYVLVNALYSLGAKDLPLVDVFLLSSGYVLRVLLGCALLGAPPSHWLLLCSSALALFLALVKRRADLARGVGSDSRPSLAGYSVPFLDQAIAVTAATTLVAYALYCMDAEVLRPGRELASLPFVLFGVLDYLRVSTLTDRGGSPVDLVLSSPALSLCGAGWAVATAWSVGLF